MNDDAMEALRTHLADQGLAATEELLSALTDFVSRTGGIDEALDVLEEVAELDADDSDVDSDSEADDQWDEAA